MVRVFLSLGSNIGDRKNYLMQAIAKIKDITGCKYIDQSKIYETEPWGYEEQASFLNLCLCLETKLSPHKLLEELQSIEIDLERVRKIHWGPRTIDIDILLFDDIICEGDELIIPHPRMKERAFVLIPLNDLDSTLIIDGEKIEVLIKKLDANGIKEYTEIWYQNY